MDCKEVRNLLSEYLENENFAQREFVREHLGICKNCAIEFEELKATVSAVAGLEKLKAPEGFLEGVHRKLKPEPRFSEIWKKFFYPLHIKLPLEVVAVAATAFLVLTIYNQSALKPKPQELILETEVAPVSKDTFRQVGEAKSEIAKAPVVVFPQKETTITLISHDIDRDLKLLPVLVNEVGGKIIAPPREAPVPVKSFDMTFQIPSDKLPIFMQKLEAIGPPRAEFEKAQAERALRLKEAPSDEPVLIHLKLNTPQ